MIRELGYEVGERWKKGGLYELGNSTAYEQRLLHQSLQRYFLRDKTYVLLRTTTNIPATFFI